VSECDFDAFVGALQESAGRSALVEIMRTEDHHVMAELRGVLRDVELGEDFSKGRRGVGWVPVGDQSRVDRGSGFWIDRARWKGAEVTDVVFRATFDDALYVVTVA
jgi:hypothetical protein